MNRSQFSTLAWTAWLAVAVVVASAALLGFALVGFQASAKAIGLKRHYEHTFDGAGWALYPTGSKLVALNRSNLKLEVLDAVSGKTILVDSLDSYGEAPRLIETLQTSKGEFLITLVRENNHVELHAVDNKVSWEVQVKAAPLSLQLVEGRQGNVFLVVTSPKLVTVYRRHGADLEVVTTLPSRPGYKSVEAMRSTTGLLVLSLFERDSQVHVVQLDPEGGSHEHVTLTRPKALTSQAEIDGRTNDFITALVSPRAFRFYVEGERDDSSPIAMTPQIFPGAWVTGPTGRPVFAAVHRSDQGVATLTLNDPYLLAEPVSLDLGEVSKISNLGMFQIHQKTYYYYLNDQNQLLLQSDSETSLIRIKPYERFVSVDVVPQAKALAILVEIPGKKTTLKMVGVR